MVDMGCVVSAGLPKKRKRSLGSTDDDDDDDDDDDEGSFATWEFIRGRRRRYSLKVGDPMWQPITGPRLEEAQRRKARLYLQGQHNCWRHCDYPSECLHTIYSSRMQN